MELQMPIIGTQCFRIEVTQVEEGVHIYFRCERKRCIKFTLMENTCDHGMYPPT